MTAGRTVGEAFPGLVVPAPATPSDALPHAQLRAVGQGFTAYEDDDRPPVIGV